MPIERVLGLGNPRIIGGAIGGAYDDDEDFLSNFNPIGPSVARGVRAVCILPDGTVNLWYRTDAATLDDGDLWRFDREIVSETNGTYLGSIVTIPMFLHEGEPIGGWARMVGIASIDNEAQTSTFGLVPLSVTD